MVENTAGTGGRQWYVASSGVSGKLWPVDRPGASTCAAELLNRASSAPRPRKLGADQWIKNFRGSVLGQRRLDSVGQPKRALTGGKTRVNSSISTTSRGKRFLETRRPKEQGLIPPSCSVPRQKRPRFVASDEGRKFEKGLHYSQPENPSRFSSIPNG
jgi:hypothetical protein